MTERSARAEVRNPLLTLPAVQALRRLDPASRIALQTLLLEIRDDCRLRAEKSWRSRKPPVAAYWAACAVYAGHISRSIDPSPRRKRSSTASREAARALKEEGG